MVNEGSPGFGRVADCRVLTAVLVERGDGRTLGFEFLELIFEGHDCVEVVLVVGFEPGMVSLEGVGVEVGVAAERMRALISSTTASRAVIACASLASSA